MNSVNIIPTVVAIIFDKDEFLLMEKTTNVKRWRFVQGGKEKGETDEEALKREINEETGLKDFEIVAKLDSKINYWYVWEKGKVHKFCIFFIVKTKKTDDIKLSVEHTGFKWAKYEEALESIAYDKEQLKEAWKLIKKEGLN